LAKKRHEGRIEGAFGEERAEEVGEAKGNDESLRNEAGADDVGHHHIPGKTEEAADEGYGANSRGGAKQGHLSGNPEDEGF